MRRKLPILVILTLIFLTLNWSSIGNNLTVIQAEAATCRNIGQISSIQDGIVQKQQPEEEWQKISQNSDLCDGDLLKTTSNQGKKVKVKVKCFSRDNDFEWSVPADTVTGVTNGCPQNESRSSTGGGGR